jgi:hypothetical protein
MRRFIRRALLAIIARTLIVWLAANLFINVGLEPILNGKPEKVRIRSSFAWMWLPGELSVWGLEIRGRARTTSG